MEPDPLQYYIRAEDLLERVKSGDGVPLDISSSEIMEEALELWLEKKRAEAHE